MPVDGITGYAAVNLQLEVADKIIMILKGLGWTKTLDHSSDFEIVDDDGEWDYEASMKNLDMSTMNKKCFEIFQK